MQPLSMPPALRNVHATFIRADCSRAKCPCLRNKSMSPAVHIQDFRTAHWLKDATARYLLFAHICLHTFRFDLICTLNSLLLMTKEQHTACPLMGPETYSVWVICSIPALHSEHHGGDCLHDCTVDHEEAQRGQHCWRHESSRGLRSMQLLGGPHQYDAQAEHVAHNVEEVVLRSTKDVVVSDCGHAETVGRCAMNIWQSANAC